MEKVNNTQSSVVVSKSKGGYEKIIFNISFNSIFRLICCFIFSSASVFSSMLPFGAAFYGATFNKSSWIASFLVSSLGLILSKNSHWGVYIAILTFITASLGFFDTENQKTKRAIVVTASFFLIKLGFVIFSQFIIYDILGLILESAVVFALVFVFQTGFPTITSLKNRSFISTSESICTMAFLSLCVMALSDYPPAWGFNLSGTFAVLMIYIFSLGGVNGGALILSVLMGTIGSLKTGSFGVVTGSYAFGALMASAFCNHGRIAVVLGFIIANTFSSLILTDASVIAVNIYDSLGAAAIFAFLPSKYCDCLAGVFSKNARTNLSADYLIKKSRNRAVARLEEMGRSLEDLSAIYKKTMVHRELGKDYIISKFNDVKKVACTGCVKSAECFGKSNIGYMSMSKMLETAFRYGRVSPHTMPKEFRQTCKRCDSFCEKFNSMFSVIKTERRWLSKLNDTRQLISCQLHSVSEALLSEAKKCESQPDFNTEEKLMAEFDKDAIMVFDVTAQKDRYGDFYIEVFLKDTELSDDLCTRLQNAVSRVIERDVSYSYPGYAGEKGVVSFFSPKNYRVDAGFASKPKKGEKISGDSFKLINSDGKNYYAVLSDGMGSGTLAKTESTTAVCLMEKFITSGFDSNTAVKLINSSLLLKSSKDSFSTL